MKFLIFLLIPVFFLISCDDGGKTTTNNNNTTNNSNNSNNNLGYCGDGMTKGEEECDDNNMTSGDGCSSDCKLEYHCGDGVKEFDEECDGTDLGVNSCVKLGFLQGELSCNDCHISTDNCSNDSTGLNILGWYKMDSLSGQEPNYAQTNNLCVVYSLGEGAIIRDYPGAVGSSIFFDGSFGLRGFMDCGPGYTGMNQLTIETWVEVGNYPNDLAMLIANTSSHDATGIAFYMAINGDFKLETAIGSWDNYVVSNSNIITRAWHHVAFTYDGTDMKLYVDGELDISEPYAMGAVPNLDTNLSRVYMGNNYLYGIAETDHFYTGALDEIKIWDIVRTDQEVCFDAGGIFNNGACELE